MSYLDYPRLHFTGGFLADPSTVNNTPNNYADVNSQINQLELYWNPNGTGIFNFQNCVVTKVVYGPGNETSDPAVDPVIGQSVIAVFTANAPKLVDLDPDQQNVSEIWGMSLQVAGVSANPASISDFVRGDYVAGSFNAVWVQARNGPRSSASGCGVYQSSLVNLSWSTSTQAQSPFLTQLKAQSPNQLCVNFVVNAHNNAPVIYAFNNTTLAALVTAGVPQALVSKLTPMTEYFMNYAANPDGCVYPLNPGNVPTASYVNFQLNQLLGQADANTWGATILATTLVASSPQLIQINTPFPTGLLNGTIGPQTSAQNVFYTPSRTMAPWGGKTSICYFAPFEVQTSGANQYLTVNLGNSLATNMPGYNDPANGFGVNLAALGDLFLVYFDQNQAPAISLENAVRFAALPTDATSMAALMNGSAGLITLQVDPTLLPPGVTLAQANAAIASMPLGLIGKSGNITPIIWLAENIQGYNLRADQFVFRMNPGVSSGPQQPYGETAIVRLYATVFGQPAANCSIDTWMLSPTEAITYTVNTLGTQGTRGIKNIATPQSALTLTDAVSGAGTLPNTGITRVTTNAQGVAELKISATDPGFPRASQNVDGQVYFIRYNFTDPNIRASYTQDANDLISILLFSQQTFPANPTWDNCIQTILPQYAKLYPIMGRFQLNDYDTVVQFKEAIRTVLAKPMEDALHMPVIRDLSISRTQVVLQWFDNGTPKN